MPASVLPDNKVRRWVRLGLGNAEIARRLEREDHVVVTPQAISVFRSRHGLQAAPGRHSDLLPWRVKREHANLYVPRILRQESRRRAGERLNPQELRKVERFLQRLRDEDAVVAYAPASAEGFWLVPREEGDRDIIRQDAVE